MKSSIILPPRRQFLRQSLVGVGALTGALLFERPGLFADLLLTPSMTEGPFYPNPLPLDTDNDLLILNDSITPAVGQVTHLSGTVMDRKGNPIPNARVEIWQVDGKGVYLHPKGGDRKLQDKNFQGFGRFITNLKGQYYFRTVKPVSYPGRTPHIHVAVYIKNKRVLTTQCLIKGHAQNQKDGLFKRVKNPDLRNKLLVKFQPLPDSKIGELTATFDIVVGLTPAD
ncbi:protocatechuate 3,4-dioxygenase [Mariniblastus sp.]|nr:protocatechuate 3,4-dioxygenase [Mariniblastus sp.]MDB4483935.1 protocatechuate 3,4-dioxygenase [bacterium]MDA7903057.1 protocatechuate 3,4-dioxygenase [Mariniblastus sp.]MDA7906574.1 protocatechuate 3,4-dioxygenase [Mariniblastus sp.]MDA7924316.1 protocatechuate 3,4-dioxygenase [Mariniblastus sp.]